MRYQTVTGCVAEPSRTRHYGKRFMSNSEITYVPSVYYIFIYACLDARLRTICEARHNMALFSRSIPSGGYFICAMPRDKIYFLVFESPPENCFSLSFIETFRSCLKTIEERYPPGVLVTASRNPHVYCGDLPLKPSERQERQAGQLLKQVLL